MTRSAHPAASWENRVKGVVMKRSEDRKAHLPVNGFVHMSVFFLLSFFIFSGPGYGSTDVPVNFAAAPVSMGSAVLFADYGGGSGSTGETPAATDGESGTTLTSTFVGFRDDEADHTETLLDSETGNGATPAAQPRCQDSCPF